MDRPEGGEIIARDRIEELDVTILRFGNGVEVWYKPTEYGDRVYLNSFSYGGATQHPPRLPDGNDCRRCNVAFRDGRLLFD